MHTKRTLAVSGIGLGILVLGMLWSIVNTALASIQRDLSANVLDLSWMMNSFGILMCVFLLTMGKLGDAYGRKKIYLLGLLASLVASSLAGFAKSTNLLIFCMALYGFSGSMILPLSQALLVHQYPESEKEKAVAIWSVFVSIALSSGPLVGGLILNWLSWRWIYWINVPIVLVAIAMVTWFVEKEKEHHKSDCDWSGVAFLALIVASLIMAILQGPTWGWISPPIIGLFILFLAALCIFVFLEKRAKSPLFHPEFFAHRSFLFSALPNGCTIGFVWIIFFLIPLYLQNIRHLTPLGTGLVLMLITLPVVLFSVSVSKAYKRRGAKPLLYLGFSCFGLGFLLQAAFAPTAWTLGASCLTFGFGWVLVWGPSISCALSTISHHQAGIASGMFNTLQELGAILSLSIATAILQSAQKKGSPFLSGYQNVFWFALGIVFVALLMTRLLPRKIRE